jgi:hypothetical protein
VAMNIKVDEPVRTITLELDSATADKMARWMLDATNARTTGMLTPKRPYEISELFGALRSIADNRGYGGHLTMTNEDPINSEREQGAAEVANENAVRGMKRDLFLAINGVTAMAEMDDVNWGDLIAKVEEWATTLSPGEIRKGIAIALGNETVPDWETLRRQAEKLVATINGGLGVWVEELRNTLQLPTDARTTWSDLMRQVQALVDGDTTRGELRREWRNQLAAALGMDLTADKIPSYAVMLREVKDMREIPRTDHSHVDCNASFNELRRRSEWLIERARPDQMDELKWIENRNNWRRRYGVDGPILGDSHPKPVKGASNWDVGAEQTVKIISPMKFIHVRTGSGINLPGPTVNIHQAIEFYVLENGDMVIEDSSGPVATYKDGHWDTVMVAPEGSDIYAACGCHDPADKEPTSTVDGFGRHAWDHAAQTISDPVPDGLVANIQHAVNTTLDNDGPRPGGTLMCVCGWAGPDDVRHGSRSWHNNKCKVHNDV